MENIKIIIVYLCALSVVTVILTLYDKFASKHKMRRIREMTLLALGFFGGAAAEYIVMRIIRHKTRKKKFMVTLPLFIVLHVTIAALVVLTLKGVIVW